MKPPLLFLCHRLPYPPNKGDKIRSWHLLQYLSRHYQVYLGTFIDDPADEHYRNHVEELCEESCILTLNPLVARLKSVSAFFTNQALSVPYYRDSRLWQWVHDIGSSRGIQHFVAFSSPMAAYIDALDRDLQSKLIDFVDMDSDKWLQYVQQKRWPMSWLYRRESRLLHEFERQVAARFDSSLFVSSAEADLFRQHVPESAPKIDYYNNGVDAAYFSPHLEHDNPYKAGEQVLVFTGAMDYWPNTDAVSWFVLEVLPHIRAVQPQMKLYIVGSNPTRNVQKLAKEDEVIVTGRVKDVRPYLHHALAAVAPMRIARGVQNKVLEAMAMARPTIVSEMGLEGIAAHPGKQVLLANCVDEYVTHIRHLLAGEHKMLGVAARELIEREFDWSENLDHVGRLLGTPKQNE